MSFFRSGGYQRGGGGGKKPPPPPPESNSPGGYHRDDRHTSKKAARSINASKREQEVFDVVKQRGDLGTTSSDVHKATGIVMQTVTPRWAPLCRKGYVKAKLDSEGYELARKGHLNHLQIIWYPREPDDPIYVRPKHALEKIKRLLPSLEEDEVETLFDLVREMRNTP